LGGALSIGVVGGSRGLRIGLAPTAADSSSNFVNVVIPSSVTSAYRAFGSSIGLNASGFTLPNLSHFEAIQDGAFTAGVVTNHYGFRVNALISGTNVFGFHSNLASATGVWNLYMAGSANNYIASKLLIGTTTDAGFKLDVNGTARVIGISYFDGIITAASGIGVLGRYSLTSDGVNGLLTMANLANTFNLKKYIKIVGDGVEGNNDASAALQIDGTTRGFLPPRMTTTQKNAIGTPAAGLQVYDTTLNQMSYYNGTTWVNF
jgi:hypothetical protein